MKQIDLLRYCHTVGMGGPFRAREESIRAGVAGPCILSQWVSGGEAVRSPRRPSLAFCLQRKCDMRRAWEEVATKPYKRGGWGGWSSSCILNISGKETRKITRYFKTRVVVGANQGKFNVFRRRRGLV